jgi:hypothetical protein
MVGKTENILVDFDSNNIVIVDPNRVIDDNGVVRDRYVKQEDLVMYANLTCQVFPRTKLALGVAINDAIQTISIASINFLSPGGETYLNNRYVDEITGKGSLQGQALNQPNKTKVTNPKNPDDVYYRQNVRSNGEDKATDNGLLGITKIDIRQGLDFMPTFNISLEDVKGRALFEAGNSSPYAAFFNMPYPMFELTLKGFYGKGVRYKLMLRSFNARYDYSSGNFIVDLIFHTYQYGVISEVSMGYLLATPYMYQSKFSVNPKTGTQSNLVQVTNQNAYKGYEKIKEMYAEYKTKGLIPENFPEITIAQLRYSLENFVKNVLDNFTKQNLTPLNDITEYENILINLRKEIYITQSVSWFEKYMDTKNYLVLKESNFGNVKSLFPASAQNALNQIPFGRGKQYDPKKIYTFKPEIKTFGERENAKTELDKIVKTAVKKLNENRTLGSNGKYTVNNKTKESAINIKDTDFKFNAEFTSDDVDLEQTYFVTKNTKIEPTNEELVKFKADLINKGILKNELTTTYTLKDGERVPVNEYYYYEGKLSFTDKLDDIENQLKKKKREIEEDLTNALYDQLKSTNNGIGFIPTIRNVLAVIFASGEGFIRLLDEVHKKSWDVRDEKVRKNAIFNSSVANANPDAITSGVNEKVPVYPWPTFLQATMGEDGHEKFEPKYPGDSKIIQLTKGYDYTMWPEVEFVEEFIKGFTDRGKSDGVNKSVSNEILDVKRISLNPIEFPISNQVFQSKEEVKYFYEIFERLLFISTTSRLNRISSTSEVIDIVASIVAQSEVINIKESLSNDNPFLIKTLSDYAFSSNNFVNVLRHVSNQGVGVNWQNYIRGIYNTPYIKELNSTNKFLFLDELVIQNPFVRPTVSLDNEDGFIETLTGDSKTNNFDLLDVYPFMDISWIKNQLPGGKNVSKAIEVYNTTKTVSFDKQLKTLTNFSLNNNIIPITNFVYKGDLTIPTPEDYLTQLKMFYNMRTPDKQLITEGNLNYVNYSGGVSNNQTISMLNTPYFVNAIQEGIVKFRNFDKTPFVSAAYLFLNSLPISTLREKYKIYDSGINTELDYIFATLKKFGATHKLPYPLIVKLGSIWHRYKRFVNNGVDILQDAWKNFDYLTNYDPVTSNAAKNYTLTVDGGVIDIILQKNSTFGTDTSTLINTGFYPKLINDMNVFYQGFEVFSAYTNTGIQSGIDDFKVSLKYVPETLIRGDKGFDKANPKRDLKVIPWSVYVETTDSQFVYPLPSMGSIMNQAYNECFSGKTMNIELMSNTSLYNGTVRNFWALPTYGYFDNSKVFKNNPKEYLKEMKVGKPDTSNEKTVQENFGIKGDSSKYADISELFSVFEKDILDLFEEKFLNFSKSMYDINTEVDYGLNFQKLMVEMMKIPKPTGTTSNDIVNDVQTKQLNNINQNLTKFIETSMYVKYGNPGNYDRKLFLSFSNYQITDPYEWTKYQSITPNALPTNNPNEWKALETYIGFSEINKLKYSNNGSYITDFFVDMNVAFTVDNIKTYSPIIKIYATQKLQDYVDSAIIPSNEPNVNSYAILTDGNKIELLPTTNNRLTPVLYDPNKQLLYAGPSRVMFLYSEEELFEDTITDYYGPFGLQDNPIVTKYIRPKGLKLDVPFKSNFNMQNFKGLVDEYIDTLSNFQDKAMNNLMLRLQTALPSITQTPEQITNSKITDTIGKLEHWECFKSLNDKWIAGYEFNNKTLFEDVLLLDRASRNIGDKILVDIYKLKTRLDNLFSSEPTIDMLSFVESILIENNFVVMNLPSYVNFYNVQEVVKKPTPKLEGTLEFANNLFGTFLNVDVRQSSAKMVCTYAGKPSEYLAIKNVDFKFRDDAFDITKASDNPLLEDQKNKEDWATSNRVVGFNVDIGPENQSIFFNFSVGQESGTATAESLEVENMMANMSSGKNSATQSISLYNIYKNRSYTCTVSMMGNALIQPTMYFNLRYVPMFYGPYMITQVNHVISPGVFETTIEGIRQPTASVLKIDDFIQTLKTSLLKSVIETQKESSPSTNLENSTGTNQNIQTQTQSTLSTQNKIEESDACKETLYEDYKKYTPVDSPTETSITVKDVQTKVVSRILNKNITDDNKLKYVIFASLYLSSYYGSSFKAYENNFTNLTLISKWSSTPSTKFFCKTMNSVSQPFMVFKSIDENIDFLIERYKGRMVTVKDNSKEEITKFIILNDSNDKPETVYSQMDKTQLLNIQTKVEESIKLFNPTSGNVSSPPPKLNPLVDVYKYAQTTPPLFESLTITVDPKIDGPREIFSINFDYETDANCAAGRGTGQQFNTNLISNNKQQVIIELQDLLDDLDCSNVPSKDSKGTYKFKVSIYTTPLKPDGTKDNARADFYKSYPITFTL